MRKLFYKDSNLIHGVTGPITQAPSPHPGPPSKASTLAIRRSVHELWGVYNIQATGRGRGPAGAQGPNPTSSTRLDPRRTLRGQDSGRRLLLAPQASR